MFRIVRIIVTSCDLQPPQQKHTAIDGIRLILSLPLEFRELDRPDTRHLLRTEVFPNAVLYSGYGSTMILGNASERLGLTDDDPCVYDPFSPYMSFGVVDPDTGQPVPYGERGQVVMHHVSKSLFLPNNLERDYATRIEALAGQVGDSVADVAPVPTFDNETVIEGVY